MKKRGLTILYIPQRGGRSIQLHLSYAMILLLGTILSSTAVGLMFLVWESIQIPKTNVLLQETLELGQNKREFEEELHAVERRIGLLEIYALQAQRSNEGGPIGLMHQQVQSIPPVKNRYFSPVDQPVARYYRSYHSTYLNLELAHQGLDFWGSTTDNIFASQAGTVTEIGENDVLGNYIVIVHDDEFSSLYAHLSVVFAKEGDWVEAEQKIAKMGQSGQADGVHLHFELLYGGFPINPLPYLQHP